MPDINADADANDRIGREGAFMRMALDQARNAWVLGASIARTRGTPL